MARTMPQASETMRKSPTQARAEHTVDAILEAAAQILQSDGEEKLNTNRIAERAGFSIGTLYQYFADKEAIIAALAERERDKVLASIVKAMSSVESDDAEKVTREIVRTMIGSFAKRKRARRIIMMTMLKRWQFAPDKQGTGVIEQMLVEGAGRGHNSGHRIMTPAGAFVLTRAFMGAIRAAVLENSPHFETQEFEDELVHLVMQFGKA
jgi:AcrR family transcriptional regulator